MSPASAPRSIAERDPARARRLLAGLSQPRWGIPPAAPGVVVDDAGEIIDIEPPARVLEPLPVVGYPVRHTAVLASRTGTLYRPLPAAEKTRLWTTAVAMEAATKTKGSRGGCFGASGLHVLNRLLFRFANTASGRCDPSLDTLQRECALCRATIVAATKRLAASGIIVVTRRWLRVRDPATGRTVARQITNAYSFAPPQQRLFAIPARSRSCRPVPRRSVHDPMGLIGRALLMSSLTRGELRHTGKHSPFPGPSASLSTRLRADLLRSAAALDKK